MHRRFFSIFRFTQLLPVELVKIESLKRFDVAIQKLFKLFIHKLLKNSGVRATTKNSSSYFPLICSIYEYVQSPLTVSQYDARLKH